MPSSSASRIISSPLNPYVATIILAFTSIIFAVALGGKLWGITTGESQLGGHLLKLLGFHAENLSYFQKFKLPAILDSGPQIHVFGLIIGGLVASLLMGEFAIKQVPGRSQLILAITGGTLLGYGSRLAAGCNIGNFWSAFPSAGLNAVTFFAGIFAGTFITVKAVVERVNFLPNRTHITFRPTLQKPLGAVILLLALAISWLQFGYSIEVWFLFGLFAAYIGYRSRLCFASAYRDTLVSGAKSGRNAAAVALGLIVQSSIIIPLVYSGYKFEFSLASGQGQLQVLIGGLLFGVGVVLLGGCIFSSSYRAGAGSITSIVGWLSTVFLGMPLLSFTWPFWTTTLPTYAPNVTLYSSSLLGGAVISIILPAAWLFYAARIERLPLATILTSPFNILGLIRSRHFSSTK